MKMITKEIVSKTPELYSSEGSAYEATVTAHWFCCRNGWDWYMTELDADNLLAFGYVQGWEGELGYFSIKEFKEINEGFGFEMIERDLYWTPRKLQDVINERSF